MKLVKYLFIALVFVSSCKEDEEEVKTPNYPEKYGAGMYVVTDNGITFVKDDVVEGQIYQNVNGTSITSPKKIKFSGSKAYIVADKIRIADAKTFGSLGTVGGFEDLSDLEVVSHSRLFTLDKGDSKLKVVDLDKLEITSDIETGDSTHPAFIISHWYRSYALNGGGIADSLNDSTIVAVDFRDNVVPLADFMGKVIVGDNPSAAIWHGNLKVLCKGIYDENNIIDNVESSFYSVDPWGVEVDWSGTLSGIYNAKNLVKIDQGLRYYFTAKDGIYWMVDNPTSTTQVLNVESDVLALKWEWYAVNDSTNAQSGMLYFNDVNNAPNTVYKYNLATSAYCDTIVVDGPVRDINFY